MYIDPFWFGLVVGVLGTLIVSTGALIWLSAAMNKKKQQR